MTILWAGAEDFDFTNATAISSTTTTSYFRPSFARCAVQVPSGGLQAQNVFSAGSFWLSGQMWYYSFINSDDIIFTDGSLLPRLVVHSDGSNTTWQLYTVNAAGTRTQIGPNFSTPSGNTLHKLDIAINYATLGSVAIYADGAQIFSYSGNITTDTNTSLNGFSINRYQIAYWSELIVSTTDTRSMSLATLAPNGFGGVAQWTGSLGAVTEIALTDANTINTNTAGQIEEFTLPTLPAGTFSVAAVIAAGRMSTGGTGPQHVEFGMDIAGSNYWSSPVAVGSVYSQVRSSFGTNPATGVAWVQSDLASLGISLLSVT